MALVKKSALTGRNKSVAPASTDTRTTKPRAQQRAIDRGPATNAVERIDRASQDLASGLAEASAAATELQRAIEMISSGAEEAAGAAQESLGLVAALRSNFSDARLRTDDSRRQTEGVQTTFGEISAQIESSVAAIELSAQRQLTSVTLIASLEEAATNIDAIGATVADISDQTSLLALNATIEAGRANEIGVGFSVIADEVRALAETSEFRASEIRKLAEDLAADGKQIADRVRAASATATNEAQLGHQVVIRLKSARSGLASLGDGALEILKTAQEAEVAVQEAERGAEQVASAAEQQSAAAAEAQMAIVQQSAALEQSQQTAEALGGLTEQIQTVQSDELAIQQVAAAAEQLSATVQELSGASGQILVALEQIGRGTQVQAAATLQANAAMSQIELSAQTAHSRADEAANMIDKIVTSVAEGREMMERLVRGVALTLAEINQVLNMLAGLIDKSRGIEKLTDSLAMISTQTSMLAVSGAVEATRAGAAGVGFANVARDIRQLSRDARESAERTKDMVWGIQDQVVTVRREFDQVIGAAETEIARNRVIVERFAHVAAELSAARLANGDILASAADMLSSVREVLSGTSQIAEAADMASSAMREATASAREQAQGAELLAAAIEDIASIADHLSVQGR